jgi:hypothetical protein
LRPNFVFGLPLVFDVDLAARSMWERSSVNATQRVPFKCHVDIYTNVSTHRIPLYLLDGSVELFFFDSVSDLSLFLFLFSLS